MKRYYTCLAVAMCFAAVIRSHRQAASAQEHHASVKIRTASMVTKPPFYYGKWKVVGYKVLPVAAMSEARARSWLGRTGEYGPDSAEFHGLKCENTSYLPRKISIADFIRDYRCKPADLGIPPGTIEVIEVDSSGHTFDAPGGALIKRADGKMLMFWVGVFFILQKQ